VAVIEEFHPGSSEATFPPELIRADPPLSPSKNASTRYAVPEIAEVIARHRGGRADEMGGKNLLDHLIRCGLVRVEDVKVSRAGSRADTRKGVGRSQLRPHAITPGLPFELEDTLAGFATDEGAPG
jgi:hypothetical protein